MSNESFPSPQEAAKAAREKRPEGGIPESDGSVDFETPPPRESAAYRYFFTLQGEVEKEGGMDYHTYAERLWSAVAGADRVGSDAFGTFEKNLIAGLHDIKMKDIVYEHVREAMPQLIEQYKDKIKHFSLWSTGDVKSTSYQVAKIDSARIAPQFLQSIAAKFRAEGESKDDARKFLEERTSFLVAEDKFAEMVKVLKQYVESGEPVRVVIIEDSFGNFEKARERIEAELGAQALQGGGFKNIWAMYSRSGITAREKAAQDEGAKRDLDTKMQEAHTIDTFEELLDEDEFEKVFKEAVVFCDFDGVIGDNMRMRDEQAKVTMAALTHGIALEEGSDMKTAYEQIEQTLSAK